MKNVIFTFLLRVSVAAINLGVVIITARNLGAEGRGNISLITLALALTLMVHQVIGGNPLVYFVKKVTLNRLIFIAYLWSVPAIVPVLILLQLAGQLPQNTLHHLFGLSLIQCLLTSNTTLLMAYNKPGLQNMALFIQAVAMGICILVFFYFLKNNSVNSYVKSLYISLTAAFLYSLYFITKVKRKPLNNSIQMLPMIKSLFRYGVIIQTTNVIQLFNYRLSYYMLNIFTGTKALGIFSTAISLGESIWLFSKSLANIQYPKIINSNNAAFQVQLTRMYSSYGFFIGLLFLTFLILLPVEFYNYTFGNEFGITRNLVMIAAPGLLFMAFTTLHAHYFSGISQNNINLMASVAGLFVTLTAGFVLIPALGLKGACWVATLSYLANSIVLITKFKYFTRLSWRQVMPSIRFKVGL